MSIGDELLKRAKVRADETGRTLGEVIEDGLRVALAPHRKQAEPLVPLPTFGGTGIQAGIDLGSHSTLHERMDEEAGIDALR